MTTEGTVQTQAAPGTAPATAPVTTPVSTTETVDNSKQIAALAKQINDLRTENESMKKARDDAARLAEEERLKAAGNYEELNKQAKARLDALESEFKQKERMLNLKAMFAGIENEFTRDGVIAKCPSDMEPEAYFAKIKGEHPTLFESVPFQKNTTLPQGGPVNNAGVTIDWMKVRQDHKSNDRSKVNSAIDLLAKYKAANGGKYPPGWND